MTAARALTAGVAAAWLLLSVCTVLLSLLAASHQTLPGDTGLANWIQAAPFPGQTVSDAVRKVTQTEAVLVIGSLAALLLWLFGYRRQAVILVLGLVAMGLVEIGVKAVVDRPRPDPALVERRAGFDSAGSYPSGHVLATTFLYAALIYFAYTIPFTAALRWAVVLVSGFFLVMAPLVSIWLGVHWPSDILGSWALAILLLGLLIGLDHALAGPQVRFPRTFTRWRASTTGGRRHT